MGNIKERIKKILPNTFAYYKAKKDKFALIWLTRKLTRTGINHQTRDIKVIVSLTSYPKRITQVHSTIKSLLRQKFSADNVVLWLAEDQFINKEKDLPQTLLNLKKYGLTICWYQDIKSYKKLIPALQKYPNDIIVTADDDVIYWPMWLSKLYEEYLNCGDNKTIIAYRGHQIVFDTSTNHIKPYSEWNFLGITEQCSLQNFFTGYGGVLYPPHSLSMPDVLNENLFMSICPYADDIWFWAMAILNNTKIKKCASTKMVYSDNININQCFSLMVVNHNQGNDKQLQQVLECYPQIIAILKESIELELKNK